MSEKKRTGRLKSEVQDASDAAMEPVLQDARDVAPAPVVQNASGAAPQPVEFTLDITLSGLCMLVQRPNKKELLVLLPHARAHENGKIPEHLAVIGTHERYVIDGPFEKTGRFCEFEMSEGTIELQLPPLRLDEKPPFGFDPKGAGLVDLSKVAKKPPVPAQARVSMLIEGGGLCADCGFDPGALWRFNDDSHNMSTRISWRIKGMTDLAPGTTPKVVIRFKSLQGKSSTFVISALEDRIANRYRAAFYLYHTPRSELPSHPGHPARPADVADPEVNHHFGAFYDLFVPRINVALPVLISHEDDEDDDDEAPAAAPAAAMSDSFLAKSFFAFRMGGGHGFHGRLYTCTSTSAVDPS